MNLPTVDLETLAAQANEAYRLSKEAAYDMVRHAIAAGQHLLAAKRQLPHGSWAAWRRDHFEGSARSAQAYMQLARNPQRAADLPSIRTALLDCRSGTPEPAPTAEEEAWLRSEGEVLGLLWERVKDAPASDATIRLVHEVHERAEALEARALAFKIRAMAELGKCLQALGEFFGVPPKDMHGKQLAVILRACRDFEAQR